MSGEKIGWKDLEIGAVVTEPGSASAYKTGDWRSERPERENERCIKCGICYIYCPEACIKETEEGYFEADARAVESVRMNARERNNDG